MADVLTVVAKVRAAKGKGDALAALLKDRRRRCGRRSRGAWSTAPHRSAKDPELFLFYEQYADQGAFDASPQGPAPGRVSRAPQEGQASPKAPSRWEFYRSLTD